MGFHIRRQIRDAIAARLIATPGVAALAGKDRAGIPRIYSGPTPVLREPDDYMAVSVSIAEDDASYEPGQDPQVQRRGNGVLITIFDLADRREINDRLDAMSFEIEAAIPREMPRPGEILGIRLHEWGYENGVLSSMEGEGSLGMIGVWQMRYRAVAPVLDGAPDRNPYDPA